MHEWYEIFEIMILGMLNTFRKKDIIQLQCYNCKELGHYASDCPEKEKKNYSRRANWNDSNLTQKGNVNHIDMDWNFEEIEEVDVRN